MKFKQYPYEQQVDSQGFPISGGGNTETALKLQSNQIASQQFGQPGTSKTSSRTPIEETLDQQNMSPQSLAALEALIAQMLGGGSNQQRAEVARKKQTQDLIQGMLGQFSTGAAFEDAKGLMALNLQKALDANMPAIQRAVEGAGTSASSMQGLLSQNMARDSALAASALGAEQAAKYGGISANLSGTLGQLASQAMDPATEALMAALGIAKGTVLNQKKTTTGGAQTESHGGAPMNFGGGTMFKSPTMNNQVTSEAPITALTNAISGKTSTWQVGPTNQMIDRVASYKQAPGVYSDAPYNPLATYQSFVDFGA